MTATHSPAFWRFVERVVFASTEKQDRAYDLEAVDEMTAEERDIAVKLVTEHLWNGSGGWREMEALRVLQARMAPVAGSVVRRALTHPNYEVRLHAWTLLANESGPVMRRPRTTSGSAL
jgi:hypothetical protein